MEKKCILLFNQPLAYTQDYSKIIAAKDGRQFYVSTSSADSIFFLPSR